MLVMKSLVSEARTNPRTGWIRASYGRTDEDRQREIDLQTELATANKMIKKLERKIRDLAVTIEEIPRHELSQGQDLFEFTVFFKDAGKQSVSRRVPLSWNEIFATIGPYMYGYIQRKVSKALSPLEPPRYVFQVAVEQTIRSRIIDEVQNRRLELREGDIDTCIIQFKELGYIEFDEVVKDDNIFRGITLTPAGEKYLTRLKSKVRATADVVMQNTNVVDINTK